MKKEDAELVESLRNYPPRAWARTDSAGMRWITYTKVSTGSKEYISLEEHNALMDELCAKLGRRFGN